MLLSVVMPTYRQTYCLRWTLRSLAGQTIPPDRFEVIVVDDGAAEDEVAAVVADAGKDYPITLVRNEVNLGRSAARNRGIQRASGDVVVFLDADSYTHPRLLERHERYHATAAGPAVLLGSRIEPSLANVRRLLTGETGIDWLASELDIRTAFGVHRPDYVSAAPWLYAYTHNMSAPLADVRAIGGFDEQFLGWGYEDTELVYRLYRRWQRDGTRFAFADDAVCYHLPHLRDVAANWDGAQDGLRYFQRKYPHYDIERMIQDPWYYIAGQAEYPAAIADLRSDPAAVSLAPQAWWERTGNQPELWIGKDLSDLLPADRPVVTFDHHAPESPTNHHQLGTFTTFDADSFAAVVNVDLWRVLTVDDLARFLVESLRIAPRVVLVNSAATDTGDRDYLLDMLRAYGYRAGAVSDGPTSFTIVCERAR
jgi:glycosyltransferase involved in cell wall biosynthesis